MYFDALANVCNIFVEWMMIEFRFRVMEYCVIVDFMQVVSATSQLHDIASLFT